MGAGDGFAVNKCLFGWEGCKGRCGRGGGGDGWGIKGRLFGAVFARQLGSSHIILNLSRETHYPYNM